MELSTVIKSLKSPRSELRRTKYSNVTLCRIKTIEHIPPANPNSRLDWFHVSIQFLIKIFGAHRETTTYPSRSFAVIRVVTFT